MKKKYYSQQGVVSGLDHIVEFEADQISLDIPMEGINLRGWALKPLFPPVVSMYAPYQYYKKPWLFVAFGIKLQLCSSLTHPFDVNV